jgi:superfamily I DNA and/or RNA helicase|tara:strand:+ start:176 stop:490 length:315 start_codon:yes stop_codon:yes gene_type:complete
LTDRAQFVTIIKYPRRDKMASTNEERKRYVKEYIRSLSAIEECIEPYKEQKRELRSEFRENGWLNTDEIRAAVKAYRLYKGKVNIDEVVENFNMLAGLIGDEEE